MIKDKLEIVDFSLFPNDERFAQIKGKLVMADTLEEEQGEDVAISKEKKGEGKEGIKRGMAVQVKMGMRFVCLAGHMEVEIDFKRYVLTGHDVAIVLPGQFFQMVAMDKDTQMLFMAIANDFVEYIGDVKTSIELGRRIHKHPVYHVAEEDLSDMLAIWKELKRKLRDEKFRFKEEVARCYLRIFQCNGLQRFLEMKGQKQEDAQPTKRKEVLFKQFLSCVKEHYKDERSVGFYADQLLVTPKYLSAVVHEVSGNYASDWINQYVIMEAKTMLRTKNISVKEVANLLHFSNQSFFAKFFRRHIGQTPKEYMTMQS